MSGPYSPEPTRELQGPLLFHPKDILAGLGVAVVLIPQSLAYAELAGLPAQHGLYVAALAPIAAAFFASSPWLQTGPVALTSLLTLGALLPMAKGITVIKLVLKYTDMFKRKSQSC